MAGRALLLGVLAMVAALGWVVTIASWHLKTVTDGVRALEPRRFEHLQVLAVGTGGAYENQDRLGPSIGIAFHDEVALVDAGRAVSEALRVVEIPVSQPRTIYLTSLAPESTMGLDDLLLTGWLAPRATALRLIGPPGTVALARGLEAAHGVARESAATSLGLPRDGARFDAIEAGDGWSEERSGLRVRAAAIPGGPMPALAWRFEAEDRSAVVHGVGWGEDALVALARGAGVLVHEALHGESVDAAIAAGGEGAEALRREAALHTDIAHVGAIATRAGVHTLVLVRLRPPPVLSLQYERLVARSFSGNVVIADDGDEIVTR